MFRQRDLCKAIRVEDGHYFFVVNDNQPSLKEAIAIDFHMAFSPPVRSGNGASCLTRLARPAKNMVVSSRVTWNRAHAW